MEGVSFCGPFGFDKRGQFDVQSTHQFVVMSFLFGGFGVDIVGLRPEHSLPNGFVMKLSSRRGFDGPLSVDGGDVRGVEMQSFGFGALEAKLEGRWAMWTDRSKWNWRERRRIRQHLNLSRRHDDESEFNQCSTTIWAEFAESTMEDNAVSLGERQTASFRRRGHRWSWRRCCSRWNSNRSPMDQFGFGATGEKKRCPFELVMQ
jgi:hypothetical protein